MKNDPGGMILLNKPSGITSFNGLNSLKRELETGKVGHTGTLDKFAEGLIVALYGKMTKLVPEFTGMDKEYEALISFGKETDTLDPEGETLYTAEHPELIDIEKAVSGFKGLIEQTPPEYSAIHINGKRAYELARSGENVSIPSRKINIYSFNIISYNKPDLKVRIKCSKGTYIRSIARDLARKCNSRAYLKELKRLKVGPFSVDQAVLPESFDRSVNAVLPWDIFDYLENVEKKVINDKFIKDIKMGKTDVINTICLNFPNDKEYALFSNNKEFIALVKKKEDRTYYRFVC